MKVWAREFVQGFVWLWGFFFQATGGRPALKREKRKGNVVLASLPKDPLPVPFVPITAFSNRRISKVSRMGGRQGKGQGFGRMHHR